MVLTVESNRTRGVNSKPLTANESAHISSKKVYDPVTHKTRRKALKKVFLPNIEPGGLVGSDFKF